MVTTVVVHAAEPVVLPEEELSPYAEKVVALFETLEGCQNNTDRVSGKLLEAGTRALNELRRHLSDLTAQDQIMERHLRLMKEHIVCPLFSNPDHIEEVEDPRIERNVLWEARTHRICRVVFNGVSPFDGMPMEEDPMPHFFARVILQLDGSYRPFVEQGSLVNQDPREIQRQQVSYSALAKGAIFRWGQEDCRHAMQVGVRDTAQTLAQIQATNNVLLAAAQAAAIEHPLALRREVDAFKQDYETRLQVCQRQLATMESNQQAANSALRTRLVAMEQTDATLAQQLRTGYCKQLSAIIATSD